MAYLLVDGENMKGKIKTVCDESLKVSYPQWHFFNFPQLFNAVLASYQIEKVIFYFAKIKFYKESKQKSNELILEQRLLKTTLESWGYDVVLSGSVRGNHDAKGKMVFKEKGVDVRIAVDMVSFSCDKTTHEIILCSSDSDLQPAIRECMKRGTKVIYLGFESNVNKGMTFTTKKTLLIRDSEVITSMPNTLPSL
jgi:uncharacterized LabA/DUF88 family protein